MNNFKIKSYCKINLSLKVLEKLSNGYHNIESLVTFCNLYDLILLSKINKSKDNIIFTGRFKKGINNKSNTITKTLHHLRKRNFLKRQTFKINIKKNIPHGSGLGGGSANAADLLNFFNSKMNLKLKDDQMQKIANEIGFDVPVNLKRKNSLLTGKKGKILRFKKKFKLNILIVYPNIICKTKEIFAKNKNFSFPNSKLKFHIHNKKQLTDLLKKENNDLEEIVIKLHPRVGEIIDFINIQNGCCFSRITGSGSSCIGIFFNAKNANYAKKMIKLKYPKYWCVVSKTI